MTNQERATAQLNVVVREAMNTAVELRSQAQVLKNDMERLIATIGAAEESGNINVLRRINSLGEAQGAQELNRLCSVLNSKMEKFTDIKELLEALEL